MLYLPFKMNDEICQYQSVLYIFNQTNQQTFWLALVFSIQQKANEKYPFDKVAINPNHPKSSEIFQGALFWRNTALLETGTFTSSNGVKLLPGKKYRP